MNNITQHKGYTDTALTLAFLPIVLGFIIGALPVLVPILVARGLSRMFSGHLHTPA